MSVFGETILTPPTRALYVASTAKFTPAATPTDFLWMQGSATKTVKIWKVFSNAWQGVNAYSWDVLLLRRSTAGSGGTATTITSAKLDQNDANATAVIKNYTVNPTVGTLVSQLGLVTATNVYGNQTATPKGLNGNCVIFDASVNNSVDWAIGQPIVLRGTSQFFVLNGNGVTPTGDWAFHIVYSEE